MIRTLIDQHHGPDAHKRASYIGGGVYAVQTNFDVWLYAERGDVTHFIALDPFMICELVKFARQPIPRPHTEAQSPEPDLSPVNPPAPQGSDHGPFVVCKLEPSSEA